MSVLEGPRREVRHVIKDGSEHWVEFRDGRIVFCRRPHVRRERGRAPAALHADQDRLRPRELHLALLRIQQHARAAQDADLLPEAADRAQRPQGRADQAGRATST